MMSGSGTLFRGGEGDLGLEAWEVTAEEHISDTHCGGGAGKLYCESIPAPYWEAQAEFLIPHG